MIKNYFDETVFRTILYNEKIRITRVFLWIKDPDPGDPKRPDLTGSGSATLVLSNYKHIFCIIYVIWAEWFRHQFSLRPIITSKLNKQVSNYCVQSTKSSSTRQSILIESLGFDWISRIRLSYYGSWFIKSGSQFQRP